MAVTTISDSSELCPYREKSRLDVYFSFKHFFFFSPSLFRHCSCVKLQDDKDAQKQTKSSWREIVGAGWCSPEEADDQYKNCCLQTWTDNTLYDLIHLKDI